ncbi:MAG TPA: DUF4255 domain-containing protein [Prolixibacteraceae bacterium]|nr:DUF4255 domain-containing protein [Prolixibacteraceae bacterium]
MIDISLSFIQGFLRQELNSRLGLASATESVRLVNLHKDISPDNYLAMTLIHIEEEKTIKNLPFLRKNTPASDRFIKTNPEIGLNLYILLSALFEENNYQEALKQLSQVLHIFQGKNVFEGSDLAGQATLLGKITVELYTLPFEQFNNLWQTLGLAIYPSVIYRVRILAIYDAKTLGEVSEIRGIALETLQKSPL